MGRLSILLGWGAILFLGLLVVAGLLRFARARMRRGGTSDDLLLQDAETADAGADRPSPGRPGIFPDFAALLKGFVLPRHRAHPGWDRLDGATGVDGRPVAWFDHHGTVYGVNGETRFAPLIAVHDWLAAHPGEDALMVQPSKFAAGRLTLRPEVGWTEPRDLRIETG